MREYNLAEKFAICAAAFAVVLFVSIIITAALKSAACSTVFDTSPFGWFINGLRNIIG